MNCKRRGRVVPSLPNGLVNTLPIGLVNSSIRALAAIRARLCPGALKCFFGFSGNDRHLDAPPAEKSTDRAAVAANRAPSSLHPACPPATLERGHPDNRHPRFRVAIHAAHRPPHSRAECVFGGAAVHRAAQRNSSAQADRADSFRRPVVGLRRRRSGCRPRGSSAWRARRSAFAMDCTSSCITSAARCAPRPSASTAMPRSRSKTLPRRCSPACRPRFRSG